MQLENKPAGACVLECGGHDAAFFGKFLSLATSGKPLHNENRTKASPSPGGEGWGSSEQSERQLLCCSPVGEISTAEARGSDYVFASFANLKS